MRLRRRLSVLVAIALVPSLLLTAYNAARWRIFLEDETRATARSEARLTSGELEQIIDNARQLMTAMAKYPLSADNKEECASYFKSIISYVKIFREAAIIDTDGRFLCSTIPFQEALDVGDRAGFYQSLKADKLVIGTIIHGQSTGSTPIQLSMPYRDADGSIKGLIVVIGDSARLAERFQAYQWRSEHRLIIMDGRGALKLTLPASDFEEADSIAKQAFPLIPSAKSGTIDVKDSIGRSLIVGVAAPGSTDEGLFAAVALDRDSALAETSIVNVRSIAFDFVFIILAVVAVWLAAYLMIDRPVRAIIKSARKWESGDMSTAFPKFRYSDEFGQLSAALTRMSGRIDELLKQKDLLLRELQHRVMNSLALLSGLLDMQRRSARGAVAKENLANARDRVVAMGTVYRHLYQTNTLEYVEFSDFLRTICDTSGSAYVGAKRPSIEVEADSLELSGPHAISLGMLTHELITNALKHAFSDSESGSIKVTLKHKKRGAIVLSIADRGRGLPDDFKIEGKSSSLGMKMVASTVQQLGGTLEINRLKPGTEFLIHLPADIART
ncbi:MAG TPA: histidine kinase dimerization/phosphoacceptor domain -containing protein [Xanthobacteraceae bacterium]|nr:histidine kinase dimerization/phosphoacceptor domain -containing protein [Xanthobacteraceae bacterium]